MSISRTNVSFGELNEWGIPNWRVKKAYGDAGSWHGDRWRWEFYRRRTDLRDFFDEWADEARHLECNQGLTPNDRGFLAYSDDEQRGEAIDRFGYVGIPNPRIGDQPAAVIQPYSYFVNMFGIKKGTDQRSSRGVLEVVKKLHRFKHEINLAPHEVAIRFDLDKPLTPQLEQASERLRKEQKKLHSRLIEPRQNQAKWLGYVRALDGRESGATWAEITAVLYEDRTIGARKSPEGGLEPPPPQAGRQRYLQGDQLRYKF